MVNVGDIVQMTLPEKTRLESLLEWGYKHDIIVPRLARASFKARVANSPVLVDWETGVKLLCIGNSHIDAAWLWRKEDTRKKKINVTFDRALLHMKMYPEFTYTQSQAVYYDWIKELYPEIWQGILQRVKEGRWEVLGGDWVECDANIPSGESLIRQRMAGQRLYLEEFGFISDIAWADDVFGFPSCYPQILAKSGARYFYTNKFNYNEVNRFPYHAMLWKSQEGSTILAYWMQHKNSWPRFLKSFKDLSILVKPGEHVELNYMSDFLGAKNSFSTDPLPVIGNMFGHGDGGNGPKPNEIIEQLCWQHQGFSKLGTTMELFAMLEPYRDQLPVWNDELYLECHQGTLTSIHMIKENNRTAEILLHAIEYMNVLGVLGGGKDYQPEIRELWKVCLFNQFHDVLPGSSLPEVYRDAAIEYHGLFNRIYEIHDEITRLIGTRAQDEGSVAITVINDLSWPRSGIVTLSCGQLFKDSGLKSKDVDFSARDDDGHEYPCQIASFPHHDANREFSAGLGRITGAEYQKILDGKPALEAFVHPSNNRFLWILIPEALPITGLGSRQLTITWQERSSMASTQGTVGNDMQLDQPLKLDNSAIAVTIDGRKARITEARVAGAGNRLVDAGLAMYEDPATRFDAWNLDSAYHDHPASLPDVQSATIDHEGPVFKSLLLKTTPSLAGTVIFHRIYIIEGVSIVYHDILVDWQEDHKLLKYKAVPAFSSENVRCGMQFGSITRVTMPRNRFTDYKAKYEYPVQQWCAVSGNVDGQVGHVALLNRNKYGVFCHGSTMELSLLKSAKFEKHSSAATLDPDDPRPVLIDRGFWRLSVAITIGQESGEGDHAWREGEAFNTPFNTVAGRVLHAMPIAIGGGLDSTSISALKVLDSAPGGNNPRRDWFLDTRKDEACIVFRLAEQEGKEGKIELNLEGTLHARECVELDLLERKIESRHAIVNTGKMISVIMQPHEIKTFVARITIVDAKTRIE